MKPLNVRFPDEIRIEILHASVELNCSFSHAARLAMTTGLNKIKTDAAKSKEKEQKSTEEQLDMLK
jgi:hypothetical protein